jgi:hypothetical protein
MKHRCRGLWLSLAAGLQLACGDEGPANDLTYGDLIGQWALFSLVFTSDADPSTTFDFRAAGGSGSLHFEADTTFLLVLLPNPGSPTESSTGSVSLKQGTVVLTDDADPDGPTLTGTLSGQQLSFETDNAEFDFDGDGTDEPARVSAVFTR